METPDAARLCPKAVIIDDEAGIRDLCSRAILSAGGEPYPAATGAEGLALARKMLPEYVFLDIGLADSNGMDVLRVLRSEFPATRVVMITGFATVEMAVEAMKLGAHDYLAKPHIIPQIRNMIADAIRDASPAPAEAPPEAGFSGLIGVSPAMRRVCALILKTARADGAVLIQGESGTGKELAARAIHNRSARAAEPFVPVDCGAIPPPLIESELFGHSAGAFTDARAPAPGLLRSAHGGTAFLDEIGELSPAVQVKLLRALQEMEVRPVGSVKTEPLGARIIAATNRDLGQAIALGRFRRDLFYRLHVIPIFIPPLRERREDIPLLAEHFMRQCSARSGRAMKITPDALESLMRCDWPGNVRELQNVIQRAFALLDGDTIRLPDMPFLLDVPFGLAHQGCPELDRMGGSAASAAGAGLSAAAGPRPAVAPPSGLPGGKLLQERTAEAVRDALRQTGGNKRQAARLLGIGIATLYRKLKQYGISA